jgi:hypothetical protein
MGKVGKTGYLTDGSLDRTDRDPGTVQVRAALVLVFGDMQGEVQFACNFDEVLAVVGLVRARRDAPPTRETAGYLPRDIGFSLPPCRYPHLRAYRQRVLPKGRDQRRSSPCKPCLRLRSFDLCIRKRHHVLVVRFLERIPPEK